MTDRQGLTSDLPEDRDSGETTGRTPSESESHQRALAREALASGLYVALVLLATLIAVPSTRLPSDEALVRLILGAGFGLVVAHWVAFRLAAPVTSQGAWSAEAAREGTAALVGGLVTAVLAALPFMVLDGSTALIASLGILAAMPAVAGGLVARLRGRSWGRTLVSASLAFLVAAGAVVLKALLNH